MAEHAVQTLAFRSWSDFRDYLDLFSEADREKRNRWWFRGHGDSRYRLEPTIDRAGIASFNGNEERERLIGDLVFEFERELAVTTQKVGIGGTALELLARHHGLPSPYLDWTRSPFVAAYFAFASADASVQADSLVAIYMLNREQIDVALRQPDNEVIELIDRVSQMPDNRRALQQRAVFMRRNDASRPLEDQLGPALRKATVPASQASVALRSLDQMLLNATTMFYDADGAARTAAWRVRNPISETHG